MPSLIDFNSRNFRLLLAAVNVGTMVLMMLIRPVVSSASTTIPTRKTMVTSSVAFLNPTMTSLSRRQGAAFSTMSRHPRATLTQQRQARLLAPTSMTLFRKQRFGSTTPTSTARAMSIADTPMGKSKAGALLLDGLEVFTVPAKGDGHPLTVYGIQAKNEPRLPSKDDTVVLMLHGRTWSSVPVYHLLGGPNQRAQGQESYSLMESLYYEANIVPYSVDFRGFGGTPHDATKGVEPIRCVEDTETVLEWIAKRHGMMPNDNGDDSNNNNNQTKKHHSSDHMPALLGWSQGALVAQLTAQKLSPTLSKLILYGSIFDAQLRYPRTPLYLSEENAAAKSPIQNTFDGAIEDFTIEGTIPPKEAKSFADAALITDPIKCPWNNSYQFNNCDPGRVHVPTLVVAGDQDPYTSLRLQQELFCNLGRGSDRSWSILADADHAVHLLDGRTRFLQVVASFLRNAKRSEQTHH